MITYCYYDVSVNKNVLIFNVYVTVKVDAERTKLL